MEVPSRIAERSACSDTLAPPGIDEPSSSCLIPPETSVNNWRNYLIRKSQRVGRVSFTASENAAVVTVPSPLRGEGSASMSANFDGRGGFFVTSVFNEEAPSPV